jgi:ammonium transporter Rh
MTFMKWHGVTAVGFTLLITAMGLQWGIFTEAFFYGWYHHEWHVITISIYSMLDSLFAISAVLISFGAIIGKVTPIQLVTMVILELIFYAINDQVLMFGWLKLIDLGGTYVDHMFGAYFGLSVAFILGAPTINPEIGKRE